MFMIYARHDARGWQSSITDFRSTTAIDFTRYFVRASSLRTHGRGRSPIGEITVTSSCMHGMNNKKANIVGETPFLPPSCRSELVDGNS